VGAATAGSGLTALHFAAQVEGGAAATKALLAAGAAAGARTADEAARTALQMAAAGGLSDTVLVLLEAGASHADATADAAWTPLHFAAQVRLGTGLGLGLSQPFSLKPSPDRNAHRSSVPCGFGGGIRRSH